jgi:hypothetical protein
MVQSHDQHATDGTWPSDRSLPGAMKWVTDHAEEYAGRWVAVGPEGLVAAGDTLPELRAQLTSFRGVLISHVV